VNVKVGAFIVTFCAEDVLPTKLLSPEYWAVMESTPEASVVAIYVATPVLLLTLPEPTIVVPE